VAATATPARRPSTLRAPRSEWALLLAGCLVLASISLVVSRQTTYDPTAWLTWGHEIVHGGLTTTSGPSWKPLPILVTAPSAVLGDTAQQIVWVVVARAGTLAGLVLAYRLARRLAGPVAGVIAAAALLLSSGYLTRTFRGDSEGILVALGLGAVEAHLSGRRWLTFALLIGTALLRPEMLLFAGLYAAWLLLGAESRAARVRTVAIAVAAAVIVVLAWVVPEKIGSGEWLRAASRALEPVAGSPATADFPFLATFTNAAPVLAWPLYAAGVAYVAIALADGRRRDRGVVLALAALATALMAIVALMAEIGFTGNSRYLTVPVALTGILGAAGIVWLARLVRARMPGRGMTIAFVVAAAVAAPAVVHVVLRTGDQMRGGLHESAAYAGLPDAIARAGGPAAVRSCLPIRTAWFDVQAVAHALHLHGAQIGLSPRTRGTIVARREPNAKPDPRFPNRTVTDRWLIESSCPR
jgi:hypothetical protein